MPYICPICKGERRVDGRLCWACNGSAQFEDDVCDACFGLGGWTTCETCGGSGKKPDESVPPSIGRLWRLPADAEVARVAALVAENFSTFGRRSQAFSAGVDVAEVVMFVLANSPAPQVAPVLADAELDRVVLMLAAKGGVRTIDIVTEAARDGIDCYMGGRKCT